MANDALLSEFRRIALRIAPELAVEELYVIHVDQLGAGFLRPRDCMAWASGPDVLAMRDAITAAGLWRGRGSAIVFQKIDLTREAALAVLIHELAHLLPYTPAPTVEVEPTMDDRIESAIEFAAFAEHGDEQPDRPQWYPGHGRNFVRACLHLWWRLALIGEVIDFANLCAGMKYSLSPAFLYWRAIGNEPLRMQGKAFSDILAAPEPELFTACWRADLSAWMEKHPNEVEKVYEHKAR